VAGQHRLAITDEIVAIVRNATVDSEIALIFVRHFRGLSASSF
jgi:thiamine phosphate synthase YjbQ (UPF0047 family)